MPTTHTFARSGSFTVKATATYGTFSGEDTVNAVASAGGVAAAVEVLAQPDTGGSVCDIVEIVCRIPWDKLSETLSIFGGAKFSCFINDEWVEIPNSGPQTRFMDNKWFVAASAYWETTSFPNTAAVQWRVEYTLYVNEPPPPGEQAPYYAVVRDSKTLSWTPNNTVLSGDEECLIKHSVGDVKHTVNFSTTHLQDVEKGIDPKYHVTLTICDLDGNQVDQVTKDNVPLGDGSTDWEPQFAEPGGDPELPPGQPVDEAAIYSYRLSVDHGMCGDSWPSTQTSSNVSNVYLAGFNEPDTQDIIVDYHLSTNVGKAKLKALLEGEAGFDEVGGVDLQGDELAPGFHRKQFPIRMPIGSIKKPIVVIVGDENDDAGDRNRGGTTKPVPPSGKPRDTIVLVPSVSWEAAYEGQIDADPSSGGGLCIFPDATEPGGPARASVKVKVQLNRPIGGVPVLLKSFDVDDPSASEGPLDDEAGNTDNRGTPAEGTLETETVTTDDNGKATAEFTVSMKPGDNYRVVAALSQDWLAALRTRNPDPASHVYDTNDEPVSASQITTLLTVWRKLHVEVDSMGAETVGKEVTGTVLAVGPGAQDGSFLIRTSQDLDDSADRFVGGHFLYGGVDCSNVIANTAGPNFLVEIIPPPEADLPTRGQAFTLTADDWFTNDVPDPDVSVITSELARAFIVVVRDAGADQGNCSYLPNVQTYDALDSLADPVRQLHSSDAYWAVQGFGCFQGPKSEDADPNTESALLGYATGLTAAIFSEVIRDSAASASHSFAHEVGHCFYLPHSQSGLMQGEVLPQGGFSNDSLNLIRRCPNAPGTRQATDQ